MPLPNNQLKVLEVVINGRQATGGSSVTASFNIFHYRRTTLGPIATKAAFNTAFQAAIIVPLLAAMNVRYTPTLLTLRWIDDILDRPQSFAAAGVGAIATDSLPSNEAIYMLLRTALKGKSFRGSKHFSPGSEVDTTNDLLTGAGLARWQVVQAALEAPIVDAIPLTWVPCIVSKLRSLSNFTVQPAVYTTTDVNEVALDLNIGTMRKRRSRTVR